MERREDAKELELAYQASQAAEMSEVVATPAVKVPKHKFFGMFRLEFLGQLSE